MSQELEVDGTTYRLRRWEYKDGKKWLFKIVSMFASAGAGGASIQAAVGVVLEKLDEKTFDDFCGVIEEYTDVVGEHEGKPTRTPLKKVATEHMRGKYFLLARLIRAHMEAEFSDFFARIGELVPAEPEPAKAP